MEQLMEKTVLYVDDEPINLELFKAQFKKHFSVLTAISAINGLKLIEANPVDLVITDFKMPAMNGLEFIKEIKKTPPQMKCIILSGYIESKVVNEKERILVSEFLSKPWKKEDILFIVQKTLGI